MAISRYSPTAFLVGSALALAALAGLAPAGHAQDYSHARIVRLSLVDGDAKVYRPETDQWEQALVNLPIQQGYVVATGRGRAEIEFESGATARIAEDTVLQFPELALADGGRITRLELAQGTATFYANLSRKDRFLVATPHLEVAIPANARFRLDVLQAGADVRVLKGDITVDARNTSQRLTKGQTLAFREDSPEPATIARNVEPDEWDRWVADRDEVVSSARDTSLRYVSAPFSYGLADLSSYGNWFYDPFYGYVWQPWGITSGWLPYWDGRWMFFPGFGLTWVSYEPWGWLPYHYGRWVLAPSGWVWIPGGFRRWHPGLVGWLQFGDRIGWYPLGPHDRLGVVPANPQKGTVVLNTPAGVVGGTPNRRLQLTANEGVWLFPNAPTLSNAFESRQQRVLDSSGREAAGVAGSGGKTNSLPPQTAAPATQAARAPSTAPGAQPGIVFDRNEGKFVNNPETPARPATADRKVSTATGAAPAAPARRTGASPSAPRSAPASPPPRTQSPRPAPSAPRPQSAPRPTPSTPAPHSESRGQPSPRPR